MLGKILGGYIGQRVGERHGNGLTGTLVGAAAVGLARRLSPPVAIALGGAYVARKLWNRRQARRVQL
ncbi:MAG: hypothetical protein E6G94_09080 [Alphaproteobacteria bacterium]|nr:MAG: hypothetical protein E6G94_09080 [Alphaproteobacteria bacterium]